MGENTAKAARFFERKAGIAAQPLEGDALSWLEKLGEENCTVLCIGNIRGAGRALIEALQARCDAEKEKITDDKGESPAGRADRA